MIHLKLFPPNPLGFLFIMVFGMAFPFYQLNAQEPAPFTQVQIMGLLEKGVDQQEIIKQVRHFKVNFGLEQKATRPLIRAGATDALLTAIETNLFSELKILSPENYANCGATALIRGVCTPIAKKHLWVFSHRKGLNVWWPQIGEVAVTDKYGEWMQSVFVGQPHDINHDFEVMALWVDKHTHEDLKAYLSNCVKTGSYPGIPLPKGEGNSMVTLKKTSH